MLWQFGLRSYPEKEVALRRNKQQAHRINIPYPAKPIPTRNRAVNILLTMSVWFPMYLSPMNQNICPNIPAVNNTQNTHLCPRIKLVQIITKKKKVPIVAPVLCIIARAFVVAMYFLSSVSNSSLVNVIFGIWAYFPTNDMIRLKTDIRNWKPASTDKIMKRFSTFYFPFMSICYAPSLFWFFTENLLYPYPY